MTSNKFTIIEIKDKSIKLVDVNVEQNKTVNLLNAVIVDTPHNTIKNSVIKNPKIIAELITETLFLYDIRNRDMLITVESLNKPIIDSIICTIGRVRLKNGLFSRAPVIRAIENIETVKKVPIDNIDIIYNKNEINDVYIDDIHYLIGLCFVERKLYFPRKSRGNYIVKVQAVVIIIILIAIYFISSKVDIKQKESQFLSSKLKTLEPDLQKLALLKKKEKTEEEYKALLRKLDSNVISRLLLAFSYEFPENIWITDILYNTEGITISGVSYNSDSTKILLNQVARIIEDVRFEKNNRNFSIYAKFK